MSNETRHLGTETPMLLGMPIEQTGDAKFLSIISLWQPWATWIMWGLKPIETRTHDKFHNLAGKRIGIHAAKKLDPDWKYHAGRYLSGQTIDKTQNYDHALGALICTAYVYDYDRVPHRDSPLALIECETPRFGLFLSKIIALDPPIPMRGCQGIWTVPVSSLTMQLVASV
jgi:hypothetical protein